MAMEEGHEWYQSVDRAVSRLHFRRFLKSFLEDPSPFNFRKLFWANFEEKEAKESSRPDEKSSKYQYMNLYVSSDGRSCRRGGGGVVSKSICF